MIWKGFTYVINILATFLLIGMITGVIVCTVFALYIKDNVDPKMDLNGLRTEQGLTSRFYIYDEDGNLTELEEERIHGSDNRIWASSTEIPTYLKEAFVAIEDHRFWDHKGVDWYRTGGAILNFFLPSGSSYGGSTITQQLIKNVTGEDETTIQRKVQEIFRALYVEGQLSKDQILEYYLNTVYLSQGCDGVKTAAYKYFGKEVSDLSLVECAALASIVQFPSRYDPVQNPENNRERREIVLGEMLRYGKITQAEYDEAMDTALVLNITEDEEVDNTAHVSSDFVDTAIEDIITDLQEKYGYSRPIASQYIFSGGLNIYLTMDPKVQSVVEQYYLDDATFPTVNAAIQPQSAMVICDPYSGDVLAIAGRRGQKTQSRVFNYATQARRSPGSSIKPLTVYGPALDLGLITYGTVYDDAPVDFNGLDDWPKNNNKVYVGLVNINYAIIRSLNTVAVRVQRQVGIDNSWSYAQKIGLYNLEEEYVRGDGQVMTDKLVAPLALGATTLGLTVREMASAYTTFTNSGIHNKSRTYTQVLDSDGNVILDNKPESTIVFSEETVAVMIKMMENVTRQSGGSATSLTIKNYIPTGAKTGTSMDEHDKWICAINPYYVAALWVGYEQPKSLPSNFSPTPIYDKIMSAILADEIAAAKKGGKVEQFQTGVDLIEVQICKDSGKLYDPDLCGKDPRGGRAETAYYVRGTEPKGTCDTHILVDYCKQTGGVAAPGCYHIANNITQYALIRVDSRSYPKSVYVTDAQYVYRELPEGVEPAVNSSRVPFFNNMIPAGTYVGVTNVSNGLFFNRYCAQHYLHPPAAPEAPQPGTGGEAETAES